MMTTVQQSLKTDEEIREYHRNRLLKLLETKSSERITYPDGRVYDENGKLIAEPTTEEQLEWSDRKMRGPARSWERWYVGQYFTEEQKTELGLTDEDIAGKGIK